MTRVTAVLVAFLVVVGANASVAVVTASSPPDASFTYSPSTPNPDDTITLDAGGSTDNGSIVSYEWDTDGDGYYSDGDDPSDGETARVSFGSGGTYRVGLKVTDDNGNTDTYTTRITVDNPAPEPSFSYSPSTPNPDDTVSLDAGGSSDPDGSIVSYEWDTDEDGYYSDGNDPADGETASISFDSGGTYTVGLRVTDNGGKERTVTKQITVDNPAPEPAFTYSPSTPNPDDTITFDASGSSDADGSIVSYEWDGDGDGYYSDGNDPSDGETASISFDSGGTYTVGLRVTDNGGKERTVTKRITVDNPGPTADFSYSPSTPNPDDTISLDASGSSDPDGSIVSYEWDTDGDGYYSDGNDPRDGETATTSFETGGTYTVGLKVTDNGGKERTVTKQITVENPAPEPAFSYSPSTPNPDDTITLDAGDTSDPDGSIVSYEWDADDDGYYSDGNDPGDGATATVSFGSGGTYTVGLKVTDNGGKERTITEQITVENPAPTADFSYSPSQPNPDDSITLDGGGSSDPDGHISTYSWDTDGDGYAEYDGQRPTVSFDTEGTYTVGLEVEDNGGRTATVSKSITVTNTPPIPDFSYAVSETNTLQATFDAGNSTDPDGRIERYEWYIDGDYVESGQRATIEFPGKGSYAVRLVAYDNGEKQASTSTTVGVSRAPTARIAPSQTPVAANQAVEFVAANATDPDGTVESVVWTFPDGTTKRGHTVSRTFSATGTRTVSVTLTDDTGNEQTITRSVSVREPPEASFSWSPESPADDKEVAFTTSARDAIETYEWDFDGDGEVDTTGKTVERAFPDGGDKQVTLYAHGANGVTNRISQTVGVRQVPPKASFSWQPGVPRDEQDVVFNASSPDDIERFAWDFDNDGTVDSEGQTVTHAFPAAGKRAVVLEVEEATGDTATYREVVTIQQSAAFDLTASQSTAGVGDEVIAQFSVSNNVRDRSLDVKLRLDLPPSGASVASVNGGQLVSRSSTNFVTVEPGGSETLRIRLQFNDAANYSIGGTAVYYFDGNESGSRREASVDPVNIVVGSPNESTPGASGPGFGVLVALVAVLLALTLRRRVAG
ncbi:MULTISPECIES: PKD domain-containing protein [Salinibaculum]|uniref:PKD domain-containing protein n=1 Tax=Salinibaculum TaxID=2732368 RepID=UPI0030D1CCD7